MPPARYAGMPPWPCWSSDNGGMSNSAARQTIIEALRLTNSLEGLGAEHVAAFLKGDQDIALGELSLDSLARMELLIALEVEQGASITPDELPAFETLGALAAAAADGSRALGSASSMAGPGAAPVSGQVLPQVAAVYRRAIRGCRSVNQINKLHIDLENRITPADLQQLADGQARGALSGPMADGSEPTAVWLNTLQGMLAASGKTVPEPFTTARLGPNLWHYRGPGKPGEKTLLLCFSTIRRRMLIPTPVFLQHLNAQAADVLLVVDSRTASFQAGVPALGDTLEAVIATLAGLDLLKQYRRLRTFGCSGGGYPAVLAGHRLGAELAISVAGRFPGRNYWSRLRWTLQARPPAGAHSSCTALLAYSRKHGRDRKFARFLRWGAAARRLPIAMPGHDSEHNIFEPMLSHGELRHFFAQVVHAQLDALPAALACRQAEPGA